MGQHFTMRHSHNSVPMLVVGPDCWARSCFKASLTWLIHNEKGAGLMLAQRRRRWASVKPASCPLSSDRSDERSSTEGDAQSGETEPGNKSSAGRLQTDCPGLHSTPPPSCVSVAGMDPVLFTFSAPPPPSGWIPSYSLT